MEFIYALGGIVALSVFAVVFGIDFRDLRNPDDGSNRAKDPNSTEHITERVVAELQETSRD